MRREDGIRRGRSRNKNSNKKRIRDLSTDPKYRKQNYNKPHRQKNITPFFFVRKCSYANRIYRQKDAILQLREEINVLKN
jgi:hypothetical protein